MKLEDDCGRIVVFRESKLWAIESPWESKRGHWQTAAEYSLAINVGGHRSVLIYENEKRARKVYNKLLKAATVGGWE